MSCVSELVGLRPVNEELERRGGRLLAISTDPPAKSREVVERRKLGFSILADQTGEVLREYGLVHEGAGPGKSDVAIPAQVLVGDDRKILWHRVSRRIQDRTYPEELLEVIRGLDDQSSE